MRVRDAIKQDALFNATVKLVNEIGFASSSVAKIAREAHISPATVYIYYENKEDLLLSTYMHIKRDLVQAMVSNFDDTLPIRDILKKVWFKLFAYISEHPAYFYYMEQFANSPYTDRVDTREIDQMLLPIIQVIQRGIDQKIIKNVNFDIISAFTYYPVYTLANRKICTQFSKNKHDIETAFTLSWDAIKL